MAKKNVEIIFILDKSGSMDAVKQATISGFNEYVDSLRKDKNVSYTMSLTLFDTEKEHRYKNTPLAEVSALTEKSYRPDGNTALYDAAVSTIDYAHKNMDKKTKTLCVIMTDGEENSSREYDDKDLKRKIKELEETGYWTFVFLGANQDSYLVGQKFGLSKGNIANFNATSRGTGAAFAMMASNTSSFAQNEANTVMDFYSEDDQDKLEKTK